MRWYYTHMQSVWVQNHFVEYLFWSKNLDDDNIYKNKYYFILLSIILKIRETNQDKAKVHKYINMSVPNDGGTESVREPSSWWSEADRDGMVLFWNGIFGDALHKFPGTLSWKCLCFASILPGLGDFHELSINCPWRCLLPGRNVSCEDRKPEYLCKKLSSVWDLRQASEGQPVPAKTYWRHHRPCSPIILSAVRVPHPVPPDGRLWAEMARSLSETGFVRCSKTPAHMHTAVPYPRNCRFPAPWSQVLPKFTDADTELSWFSVTSSCHSTTPRTQMYRSSSQAHGHPLKPP